MDKVKSLVGGFTVAGIVAGSPGYLWRKWKDVAGTDRQEFMGYFGGVDRGYGIQIEESVRLVAPISLSEAKCLYRDFRPPQSYLFFRHDDPKLSGLLSEVQLRFNGTNRSWIDQLNDFSNQDLTK